MSSRGGANRHGDQKRSRRAKAEAPPLPAAARTPRQPRRRGRGGRRLGPPPSPRPAPRLRRPGRCQLPQRTAETRCMRSLCARRLLHVLGLRFPLPTRRPLFLCPRRLMKPLVVFVLGGPGAGKGTQCARIVEVRPEQLGGSLGLTGRQAGLSRRACRSAPPEATGLQVPATKAPPAWRWSRVPGRVACRDW